MIQPIERDRISTLVAQAIRDRRWLTLYYATPQDDGTNTLRKRNVRPVYMVEPFQKGGWNGIYLYAWCAYRREYRLFKAERIIDAWLGDPAQPPPDSDLVTIIPARFDLLKRLGKGRWAVKPRRVPQKEVACYLQDGWATSPATEILAAANVPTAAPAFDPGEWSRLYSPAEPF